MHVTLGYDRWPHSKRCPDEHTLRVMDQCRSADPCGPAGRMPVQSADRRHRDSPARSRGINEHHSFRRGVNIGRPNSCRIVFLARSEATQDQDADGDDRAGDPTA